jgi:hypothetical protein
LTFLHTAPNKRSRQHPLPGVLRSYKLEFIALLQIVGPQGRQRRECGVNKAPSDEGSEASLNAIA